MKAGDRRFDSSSSLVAPQVFIRTTRGATSYGMVVRLTTFVLQGYCIYVVYSVHSHHKGRRLTLILNKSYCFIVLIWNKIFLLSLFLHHSSSNRQQLDYLFNSLFRLLTGCLQCSLVLSNHSDPMQDHLCAHVSNLLTWPPRHWMCPNHPMDNLCLNLKPLHERPSQSVYHHRSIIFPDYPEQYGMTCPHSAEACSISHGKLGNLTLKWPGHFFFQNAILFSNDVHNRCNTFVWNWPNTVNI